MSLSLTIRSTTDVTRAAIEGFNQHRTSRMAAALAYHALFSLFPLLLLLLAFIGFVLTAGWAVAVEARQYLISLTAEVLPEFGSWVNDAIRSIQAARGATSVIGALGLVWSASNVVNHLHAALDEIWGFNGRPGFRHTVRRRATSIAIVLGLGLLLVSVQAVKSVTYLLTTLTDQVPGGAALHTVVTWFFPFIAATVVFGVMYRAFPSVSISWRDVWPGAIMAGIGWELLKWLFALYAAQFANWQAVYGSVAGVVGLLTWLYLSFTVLLFGAEFAAAYASRVDIPETDDVAVAASEDEAYPDQGVVELVLEQDEPAPERHKLLPALTRGTLAGIIGTLAVAGVGVGMLVGRARRLPRPEGVMEDEEGS